MKNDAFSNHPVYGIVEKESLFVAHVLSGKLEYSDVDRLTRKAKAVGIGTGDYYDNVVMKSQTVIAKSRKTAIDSDATAGE